MVVHRWRQRQQILHQSRQIHTKRGHEHRRIWNIYHDCESIHWSSPGLQKLSLSPQLANKYYTIKLWSIHNWSYKRWKFTYFNIWWKVLVKSIFSTKIFFARFLPKIWTRKMIDFIFLFVNPGIKLLKITSNFFTNSSSICPLCKQQLTVLFKDFKAAKHASARFLPMSDSFK